MPEKNVRLGAPNPEEQCHSVLDGPECIEGVPSGRKSVAKRASSRQAGTEAGKSVLDAPGCIEGTKAPQRQR